MTLRETLRNPISLLFISLSFPVSTPSIRSRDFLRSTRAASKASWLTVSPLEKASLNLSTAALTACILLSSTPSF